MLSIWKILLPYTEKKIFSAVFILTIFFSNNSKIFSQEKRLWKFEDTPVWSDEFDSASIDKNKWSFETGGDGWGNNELQYYTDGENVKIEKGILKIIAKKQKMKSKKYTSSRLVTRNKAEWKFVRIKIRAKMSKGRGTWPAFWMLPSKGYAGGASNGEIDILEYVGFEPGKIHFSVHTKKNNSYLKNEITKSKLIKNASDKFHIYRMDWTPYGIRGYVDGIKYFEYMNKNEGNSYWPFNNNFFLIMNLAIGGSWGGLMGIDGKIFPAVLEIDYVKVYKFIE